MTSWDLRALGRGFGATLLALFVVWLVTAASDEGELAASVRAGRTLPVAPFCAAVGAALALGSARIRGEALALEALGRAPRALALGAAIGAATPALVLAATIALLPRIDVSAFYPRPVTTDAFVWSGEGFRSPSLGVAVEPDGTLTSLDGAVEPAPDLTLPPRARGAAAGATALAGLGLALLAAETALRSGGSARTGLRGLRARAVGLGLAMLFGTMVAFQAAAAGRTSALMALAPPGLLVALVLAPTRPRNRRGRV